MKWPLETLRLFPTFACTRKCGYCVVNTHGAPPLYKQAPPDVYRKFLSTVEGVKLLLISGGEPSLYQNLKMLVSEGLARGWNVGVYSNCSTQMVEVAKKMEPNPHLFIDCSYHADYEDVVDYAERWMEIWARGYHITAATIIHPHNVDKVYGDLLNFYRLTGHRMILKPLDGKAASADIGLRWCSDHAEYKSIYGEPRTGKCYLLADPPVAPDGDIYRCHRLMYSQDRAGVIGDIGSDSPVELQEVECPHINSCNTCDAGQRRIDGVWERKQ